MLVKDGTYLPHDLTVIDGNDHVVVRVSQVSFEALGANCRIEHVLRYVFEYRLVPRSQSFDSKAHPLPSLLFCLLDKLIHFFNVGVRVSLAF